jgi:Cu-processing system permease protein
MMKAIYDIARQELVINVRNTWMVIFAVVFALLVVSISYVGMMAEGFEGMQGFMRTSASLLNLVLYLVPLVALTMGTLSFTGDKGSAELLFSQPVSRTEVLLGKLVGLFFAMALSSLAGFAAAGIIIVAANGTEGLVRFVAFVVFSLGLAASFLSISALVSTFSKRKARAFGLALFLWFVFVLFYDLLAVGGSLLMKGEGATRFLFLSLFGNPVDMVRVASLIVLDNATIFGAAGASLLRFLGGPVPAIGALVAGMAAWVGLPVVASHLLIRKQDI